MDFKTFRIFRLCSELLKNNAFLIVIFLSGFFGCFIAVVNHATWHSPVENGQALAGIVEYPENNVMGIYFLKVWSILNHFSALLLYFGISEKKSPLLFQAF
tara:strand:+ start:1350 stop:1652 length:303 start_codon:yes stop_codon:yes gene_type:complete